MEHDRASSYHPVKSIQRLREKNPLKKPFGGTDDNPHGKDMQGEHGAVTATEVARNIGGTGHTVKATHEDGHVQEHQHPMDNTGAESHQHAQDLMSGGDSMRSDGQVDTEDTECPNCGAQMVDGTCPQCGYEAKPADRMAGGDENEGGEGA